jgi:hypothetical protein
MFSGSKNSHRLTATIVMTVEEFDPSKLILPDGTFYAYDAEGEYSVHDVVKVERLISSDGVTRVTIFGIKLLREASWSEYIEFMKSINWPLLIDHNPAAKIWLATTD